MDPTQTTAQKRSVPRPAGRRLIKLSKGKENFGQQSIWPNRSDLIGFMKRRKVTHKSLSDQTTFGRENMFGDEMGSEKGIKGGSN